MAGLGHRIGPFELLERVAGGYRTSLYRAIRPDTSRPPRDAAIRMADDPEDAEAATLIHREYIALRAVHGDPHFPQVIGHYSGQAALAVTWLEGVSLADLIRARADRLVDINATTIVDVLVELAEALRRLNAVPHSGTPLLHGHLGSQRVTLGVDGEVYITGLGTRPRGRLPAYTAPEQAAGAFVDWRADQWALGAIGVELLLGERLYTDATSPETLARQGAVGPWVEAIQQQWPPIGRVLRRVLAPAAGDRYQSSDALLHDFMAARRLLGGLSQRRSLARQVAAHRDRLSAQRPPATRIDPRAEPSPQAPTQPQPIPPPPGTPVIVVAEESYAYATPAHALRPTPEPAPQQPRMPRPVAPEHTTNTHRPPPMPMGSAAISTVGNADDQEVTEPFPREDSDMVRREARIFQAAPLSAPGIDDDDEDTPLPSAVALQPNEIAGMIFATMFAVLGLYYLFTRLWV